MQAEIGQLQEELWAVEWAIREMASKIAVQARRRLDGPQPERQRTRTKTGREIPQPPRDRNMCR